MSTMPGNPHYERSHNEDAPEWAQVEATRALAHEQRTANLIALWAMPEDLASSLASASGVGNDGVQKDIYAGVAQQILGRLGL